MTRSIFDPRNPERSGSSFTGPDADQLSHLPEESVDGKVNDDEDADHTLENDVAGASEEGDSRGSGVDAPKSGMNTDE